MSLFIGQVQNDKALLSPAESHHMTRVLRMKIGDQIFVTDGNGAMFKGKFESLEGKMAIIGDLESLENNQKRPYTMEMAVAPTKQIDRLEFFLEKAIEIGLDTYYPIITFNSERRKLNPQKNS